ncbi:MAG: PD40 domain-containing protein [Sedimentisphaerales bacterium]|nr:PD40 domain-containing protein [Sedimentisphaerales bacterium]
MKPRNRARITLVPVVFVVALMLFGGGAANADYTFGELANLGPTVNSSARDEEPGLSADGLTIYYCSLRSGGSGNYDLWAITRATTQAPWGTPVNLGSTVNSSSHDFSPDVSADGLSLYFGSDRPGGYGGYDIWVSRRDSTEDPWGAPANLGPMVNTSEPEGCPAISDDGREVYFWSGRAGGYGDADIWVARRPTAQDDWGAPENLGSAINGSTTELCCDITADNRCLVFVSTRSGGYGGTYGDIWITTRRTIDDRWGPPMNAGPIVNSSTTDNGPFLSVGGSTLYFSSERPGGSGGADMWQVSISPVVDFSGDGSVDGEDLLIMAAHWGEVYPPCDIGPAPFGDGVVDLQDVIVLAGYIGKEVNDPTLIAHWALDESEGTEALDSAGTYHGAVIGAPTWRPDGGKAGGALEFDGATCVLTDSVLNPNAGPFSLLAWVKGGGPGQVIVSQAGGADWLLADPATGALMTDLKELTTRRPTALHSSALITDGDWHRVGLVWDGATRMLCVDGEQVAIDTQSDLPDSDGGLYLGCGHDALPGTFFTGLIDDMRIYNRAVAP